MLKISYAGRLGLSSAISAQFTLEMRVAALNREKFTKTPYFEGSRSFKVIDVNIPKKLVASACCKWRIQEEGGGGGRAPIDRMHLKSYEKLICTYVIFASNFQKFSRPHPLSLIHI